MPVYYLPDEDVQRHRTLAEISLRNHGVKGSINSWISYLPTPHICAVVDDSMVRKGRAAAAKHETEIPIRVYPPTKYKAEPKSKAKKDE